MEIKTVVHECPETFDILVNKALREGYRLSRRGPEPAGDGAVKLYAELVKLDPPAEAEEPDLLAAMRAIKETCSSVDSCEDCPVQPWCNFHAPHLWVLPEEAQNDGK